MFHTHPTRTLLILLAGLLVVVAIAYALRLSFPFTAQVEQGPSNTLAAFPEYAPAPKPQDYVAAQKGFQYLVSYTNLGFVPATLSVGRGEAVRFTNNSGSPLQLSLSGAQVASLGRAEYFEYTFTKSTTVNDGSANTVRVTVTAN